MSLTISPEQVHNKFQELKSSPNGITFIFGAGASMGYTSNTNNYLVPPIVANLLESNEVKGGKEQIGAKAVNIIKKSGEHEKVFDDKNDMYDWQQSNDADFEDYLGNLFSTRGHDDPGILNFLYYLQELCRLVSTGIDNENSNNYKRLAKRMSFDRGNKPWNCISFNYDTLLEQSILASNRYHYRNFNSLDDYYGKGKNPTVIKIHGSINFRYKYIDKINRWNKIEILKMMMNGTIGGPPKDTITKFDVAPNFSGPDNEFHDTTYHKFDPKEQSSLAEEHDFPLILVPIHHEKEFGCLYFKDALELAVNKIQDSSLVVVIGYNFGDKLFRESLEKIDTKNKELILIGTKNVKKKRGLAMELQEHGSYKRACEVWSKDNIRIFDGDGFSEFVETVCRRPSL